MNKLLLMRRNRPATNMAGELRIRQRSSLCETSSRWCRPFSMPPKPARFNCSVKGIERDQAAFQINDLKELACDGDFVGLGFHNPAGQVILAGDTYRSEHPLAGAVFGLLAVKGDQLVFGCWAA